MVTYVMHGGGAKERIGKRMQSHVGIAVTKQAQLIRNLDTTHHQTPPPDKTVHIKSISDPYIFHIA